MAMNKRDSITVQKESLYRLAYTVPLTLTFLYFSKIMLFGPSTIWLSGVTVNEDLQISFKDERGQTYLSGQSDFSKLGQERHIAVDFCKFQQNRGEVGCLEEAHNQDIKISLEDSGEDGVTCHKVQRKGLRCVNQMVKDCYSLGLNTHWYGGFEASTQLWPLKRAVSEMDEVLVTGEGDQPSMGVELPLGPYVTGDPGVHKTKLLDVMDRFFFSSSGIGIIMSEDSPLYLGFNQYGDGKLCLAAMYDNVHYFSQLGKPPKLEYRVCKAQNVKSIHSYIKRHYIPKPADTPHESLFTRPIWSTWALYKKDINQSSVLEFADKIISTKLPFSQLEIDDDWTTEYGDHDFDPVKFPDPKKMMVELAGKNMPVTVWIHPFLSLKSNAFKEAAQNKFTVMAKGSEVPALVRWWNEDMAAILDITNPAAVLWFQNKLQHLIQTYNVSSFKFDSGEGMYLPPAHSTYGHLTTTSQYGTLWAELAHSVDSGLRRQEVRVGWNSQRLPIVVRLFDRMSVWGHDSGLQSIIPSVLTLGVLGYPYVLPDMVGGNAYSSIEAIEGGEFPDKELYMRWIQTTLFMPCMQFSIPPWIYGDDVVDFTRSLLQLRETYAPTFIALAKESVQTGHPIIRPLWWIAPNDEQALVAEDEFLVGNDLLIAPVVVKGARKREVYLPQGVWQDKLKGTTIQGPTTLYDYPVALEQLPYFERESST